MSGLLPVEPKTSDVVVLRIDEDELMQRSRRASSVELIQETRLPKLTRRASLDYLATQERKTDDGSIVAELVLLSYILIYILFRSICVCVCIILAADVSWR